MSSAWVQRHRLPALPHSVVGAGSKLHPLLLAALCEPFKQSFQFAVPALFLKKVCDYRFALSINGT
jgi:hypothetical protein